MQLALRGLASVIVQLMVLYIALIGPAGLLVGAWTWPRGLQLIASYGALVSAATLWLAWIAPKSLEARLTPPFSASQPAADIWATALILIALVLSVVAVPLDVFAWQLMPAPPAFLQTLAGWSAFTGFALIVWVIFTNQFAILNVVDQSGKGQTVVQSGPYALVRHPMYLAAMIMQAGASLWLGSTASLIMLAPVFAALSMRVKVEEQVLMATLPDYAAYCAARRYRILPFVW